MPQYSVLISGGGIAGATLASLLARRGHSVTVVDRDAGRRSSGSPVDVRGHAYDTVARLGLLPALEALATTVTDVVLVDTVGRPIVRARSKRRDGRDLEIPRADLAAVLLDSCPEVELIFDDEVARLEPVRDGLVVEFRRSAARQFDLVVGADGLHSRVRELCWGPESQFSRPLGMYVATTRLPDRAEHPDAVLIYNEPGRAVAVHPGAGRAGAAFLFRSQARVDPRDQAAVHALLAAIYRSAGWRSRELLERYLADEDAYFDAVTTVRVPVWSKGNVALLGDAASCVSLFGEGSSSAISGAARLADALDAHHDLAGALVAYETAHRRAVAPHLRRTQLVSHLLIPASRVEIAARNALLRLAARGPVGLTGSREQTGPDPSPVGSVTFGHAGLRHGPQRWSEAGRGNAASWRGPGRGSRAARR